MGGGGLGTQKQIDYIVLVKSGLPKGLYKYGLGPA